MNAAAVTALAVIAVAASPTLAAQDQPAAAAAEPAADQKDKGDSKPDDKADTKQGEKPDRKQRDKTDTKPAADESGKKKGDESEKKQGAEPEKKQQDTDEKANAPDNPAKAPTKEKASEDIWTRQNLLGDIGPIRPFLANYGMTLGIVEYDEILGNPTGGVRQGAIIEGLTNLSLGVDLRPTLGVHGNFYALAYQIHAPGLSFSNLHSLNDVSGIEGLPTTRLAEFWYEHHFDNFRIRVGEQTVTTDFLSPATARLFVNGAVGWPTLPGIDLPTGGPGYPMGALAARVRWDPTDDLTVFTALYNGDPTGAGVFGSQLADASGTAFRTSDGAFVISELRYNPDSSDKNGTYRFGGWYNSERFRDFHLDLNDVSLASPAHGAPKLHDGDYSLYAVIDQPFLIDEAANTSFAAFARVMGTPDDRNLVSLYADAGLVYKGPFGRKDDQAGIAFSYARVGQAARDFDADTARFTGQPFPVRSGEALLELTYRIQVAPWLQVQPDFQYVFNLGGGLPNPNAPGTRIEDAAVFGLRTVVTF